MLNHFNFSNFAPYKSPNSPFPILTYSTLMEPIFQVFIWKSEIFTNICFQEEMVQNNGHCKRSCHFIKDH